MRYKWFWNGSSAAQYDIGTEENNPMIPAIISDGSKTLDWGGRLTLPMEVFSEVTSGNTHTIVLPNMYPAFRPYVCYITKTSGTDGEVILRPTLPEWDTNRIYRSGARIFQSGVGEYYQCAGKTDGTSLIGLAGSTAPTHGSGTVSDGELDWTRVAGPGPRINGSQSDFVIAGGHERTLLYFGGVTGQGLQDRSWLAIPLGGMRSAHPANAPGAGWQTEIEDALMAAGILARS